MKLTVDIKENTEDLVIELLKSLGLLNAPKASKRTGKNMSDGNNKSTKHSLLKKKTAHARRTLVEKKARMATLQSLALQGPVMDEEQYHEYKELRNRFNIWRQK